MTKFFSYVNSKFYFSFTGSYRRLDLPALVTEGNENYNEMVHNVGGNISIMPDVTASLGHMQIAGSSSGGNSESIDGMHLDLGDGSSHPISNQPRATSQMHLYSGSYLPVAAQPSRLSSSVGNYHHYMTRYMASSSSSNIQPSASSSSSRRGGEGSSSFRSSNHSHSSSFL